jgi:hypothetical protein
MEGKHPAGSLAWERLLRQDEARAKCCSEVYIPLSRRQPTVGRERVGYGDAGADRRLGIWELKAVGQTVVDNAGPQQGIWEFGGLGLFSSFVLRPSSLLPLRRSTLGVAPK